jgi:outer membrane protein TolC
MQEKYNLGAANILELLDAEVSFKQAESDQVEAWYDYNLAVAQFEKAIGK